MTISAWRIIRKSYLASAFTGEGARLNGGRWNSPGVAVVYTAGSVSLALLETLVHLQGIAHLPPYLLIEVRFDDSLVSDVEFDRLPKNWRADPPPISLARIGDDWINRQESVVLRVPSTLSGEPNYLLNPAHPSFAELQIDKPTRLSFDHRLLPESLRRKPRGKRRR